MKLYWLCLITHSYTISTRWKTTSCLTITKPQYSLSVSLFSLLLFVNISNYIFLFVSLRGRGHNCHGPSSMSDNSMVGWFSPSTHHVQVPDTELESSGFEERGWPAKPFHWSCLAHFWILFANFLNVCIPHQAFPCCGLRSFYHSVQQPEGLVMYY